MIASLEGKVAYTHADQMVIVVNGVGYKVSVPVGSVSVNVNDPVFLHTLMIVREDSMTLFGFGTTAERETFERVLSVSGVGPKMALAILGTMTIDRLRNAVATGQYEALTRVPGVGKRTAEKIIFELKDKLKGADGLISSAAVSDVNQDVLDALLAFGYSQTEAQAALAALPADMPNTFEDRMRGALQYFVS